MLCDAEDLHWHRKRKMMRGLRIPPLGEGTAHYCHWMEMLLLELKILQVRFSRAWDEAVKRLPTDIFKINFVFTKAAHVCNNQIGRGSKLVWQKMSGRRTEQGMLQVVIWTLSIDDALDYTILYYLFYSIVLRYTSLYHTFLRYSTPL